MCEYTSRVYSFETDEMIPKFDDLALQNFAGVLAGILTHSKITDMLALCNIPHAEGTNKSD